MTRDVAVVILAGGEGTRIGGRKPLLELAGERLIDRALKQAGSWSDLTAVAVKDVTQIETGAAAIITDEPGVAGPLAGLTSALRFAADARHQFVLTIPCDMPFLPGDLLGRLTTEISDCACALASSGGHLHPVCGLWCASALDQVGGYLAREDRSLRGFAAHLGFLSVDWPAEPFDPFFNINDPYDLTRAEQMMAAASG